MNKVQKLKPIIPVILSFISLLSSTINAQNEKKIPDTLSSISQQTCEFPRQRGKLEIIRRDSLKTTLFQTDSTEMILDTLFFIDYMSKEDTVISLLFMNGLLTPELLIKAYNYDNKFVDSKGDTINLTNEVNVKTIKLLNLTTKEIAEDYKYKRGITGFEISISISRHETDCLVFELELLSDIELTSSNLKVYIEKAKIKCLSYLYQEI